MVSGVSGVKEFKTKKGLLEYLGKKGNDNKLVDRMIMRGEVRKEDWMYYIVERDYVNEEYNWLSIQQLVMELEEVKKEKAELEADYIKWIQEHPAGRGVDKNNKVNTLTEVSDLEYLNNEYIKLEENREQALRKCYELMASKKIFDKEKNPFEDFFRWATWVELN